eukprot:CAMPEP_0175833538 /NCGR_PEP_ID=MMETSP0107_2-20121207/15565_1 /TAXON_ID=195067 ORGANISM="Goniomonas pacifica, Strain CCMP1869" /NCGR_SAMPLE_ID=MMETSP0107_2 /ASSEMBLY_ACC=CAM_ASM_000203 /LENGTH=99 /DNA_ID=CAMNT_0017146677 /DNA_START=227 /DNA_END=526 /DNA_ORIENTATION=-
MSGSSSTGSADGGALAGPATSSTMSLDLDVVPLGVVAASKARAAPPSSAIPSVLPAVVASVAALLCDTFLGTNARPMRARSASFSCDAATRSALAASAH